MSGSIRTQVPPNMVGEPQINIFDRGDFNQLLWNRGYEISLEEAVACPCKGQSSDSRTTCGNCMGTGWVFVNPINTKAILTSINKNTKYKDWSPEMIGTMGTTFMNVNRVSFMDKITLLKNFGMMSEVLKVRDSDSDIYPKFTFSTYKMIEIRSVFIFNGDTNVLIKLAASDYRINMTNGYVLDIKADNLPNDFNGKVSVSYKHLTTYHVIDIPNDLRITQEYSNAGKKTTEEMPVHAIARKAQYELGSATNYEGTNILNNSYL